MAIKRKPTPKPLPRQAPKPAPLDLVRSPNFDSAMAQQRYDQMLADMTARAKAGQFDTRIDEVGQRPPQSPQAGGGGQDFIDNRDPNKATTMDMVDYIDPATGEKVSRTRGVVPAPGSRFVPVNGSKFNPNLMPEEEKQRLDKLVADFAMQGADQREADIARRNSLAQYGEAMRAGGAGYAQVDPMVGMQNNQSIYDSLRDYQARTYPVPMGGNPAGIGQQFGQIPQQQMQNYQNFLQQGMQNSNTMNQGAMNNFANMQPGMQATQTASATTPNQTMPVAGMGMQQPKQTPPRKFSTVSNSPARFA